MFNFSNFIWNFLLYTTTPRIAAAAAKGDDSAVSAITAQGLWMAGAIGLAMFALLHNFCPAIFAAMGAKPEVGTWAGRGGERALGCAASRRSSRARELADPSSSLHPPAPPLPYRLPTTSPHFPRPPAPARQVIEPAVAYMRCRCLASPAILMQYVLAGTFRGFKDTT